MLSCFSHVQLCVTPWTVAHQAPLSKGFSGQEYWSGLPSPLQGIFPAQGSNLHHFTSPALAGGFFTTSATWEALIFNLILPSMMVNFVCQFDQDLRCLDIWLDIILDMSMRVFPDEISI